MKDNKPTPELIMLRLENHVLRSRTVMYYLLAFFLMSWSFVAFVVAALLLVLLVAELYLIWLGMDPGILNLIVKYLLEKYLHIIP